MVSLGALWLPILLSAVIVFIASSIIHMVLQYHSGDFKAVPKEAEVMDALRPFNIEPGNYSIPRASSMKEMGSPEYIAKMKKGPVAMMTVMPSAPPAMGKSLTLWFIFSIIVSVFAAYLTSRAFAPGADYMEVFRFTSVIAFVGYALSSWQNSIWYAQSWSSTFKNTIDGLIYGLLTGGVFGWLWPA